MSVRPLRKPSVDVFMTPRDPIALKLATTERPNEGA